MVNNPLSRGLGIITKVYLITCGEWRPSVETQMTKLEQLQKKHLHGFFMKKFYHTLTMKSITLNVRKVVCKSSLANKHEKNNMKNYVKKGGCAKFGYT